MRRPPPFSPSFASQALAYSIGRFLLSSHFAFFFRPSCAQYQLPHPSLTHIRPTPFSLLAYLNVLSSPFYLIFFEISFIHFALVYVVGHSLTCIGNLHGRNPPIHAQATPSILSPPPFSKYIYDPTASRPTLCH